MLIVWFFDTVQWKGHFNSVIFHTKTYNLSVIKNKNIKITMESVPKIHLSGTPQNCQGLQTGGKSKQVSYLREA